jgi:hypothetical protein
MKIKFTLLGLLILALGLVITLPAATAGDAGNEDPYGFGQRIAGTWTGGGGNWGGSLTLHADGTVSAMSSSCCGAGGDPNIQSEAWGNWERTGPRQVTLRAMIIGTRHDWVTGPTDNFIAVASQVLDFAPDFQSYTGGHCVAIWNYPLGQLPPDIETVPPDMGPWGPFPISNYRLPVYHYCP